MFTFPALRMSPAIYSHQALQTTRSLLPLHPPFLSRIMPSNARWKNGGTFSRAEARSLRLVPTTCLQLAPPGENYIRCACVAFHGTAAWLSRGRRDRASVDADTLLARKPIPDDSCWRAVHTTACHKNGMCGDLHIEYAPRVGTNLCTSLHSNPTQQRQRRQTRITSNWSLLRHSWPGEKPHGHGARGTDHLVFLALVVAPRRADHQLHRIFLITADVAVAHEEQLQSVLPDLVDKRDQRYQAICKGWRIR